MKTTGPDRHHIPQFLSRGFCDPERGEFLVHEIGKVPYWCGPRGWASEVYGYKAGEMDIDGGWWPTENVDGGWLHRVRAGEDPARNAMEVAAMITRFGARTKQAQEAVRERTARDCEALVRVSQDPRNEVLRAQLLKTAVRRRQEIPGMVEIVDRFSRDMGLVDPTDTEIEAALERSANALGNERRRLELESWKRGTEGVFEGEEGEEDIRKVVLTWLKRVQEWTVFTKYQDPDLKWRAMKIPGAGLILGDVVVVEDRKGDGNRTYRAVERQDLELQNVWLPVGPELLIGGTRNPNEPPDTEWIAEQSARLSTRSFIAAVGSERNGRLQELIGSTGFDRTNEPEAAEVAMAASKLFMEREGT